MCSIDLFISDFGSHNFKQILISMLDFCFPIDWNLHEMGEKFEVVISGISGRFPECDNVLTFKHKLYNKEEFITVDDRKWPVGYKYKRK